MDSRRLAEGEIDQQIPFYTFVIREKPNPRTGERIPDFTIADHGDHWHITFQSIKNNVNRKRRTICNFLGLGDEACLEATASTTLIQAIRNWILYLIRNGIDKLHHFGIVHPTFRNILKYFRDNPVTSDTIDGPCPYMEQKRIRRAKTQSYKDREFDFMEELIERTGGYTVKQILAQLKPEEYKTMYITHWATDTQKN